MIVSSYTLIEPSFSRSFNLFDSDSEFYSSFSINSNAKTLLRNLISYSTVAIGNGKFFFSGVSKCLFMIKQMQQSETSDYINSLL
jgi:hypothetical protein